MARPLKHPGLQHKFERALRDLLSPGRAMTGKEILAAIEEDGNRFAISFDEHGDLAANFANYIGRAKNAEVVESAGPYRGYWLKSSTEPTREAGKLDVDSGEADEEQQAARKVRQHWESLLHLPATVALSGHFSARVRSLPNAADTVRWGNPDMLMLRPSPLTRIQEYDAELRPDLFKVVDVTPECVLASIELKSGLERDRPKMFSALAEAAANSRWANEAWLVFADARPTTPDLDEDIVALARSVEVGLLELVLTAVDGDATVEAKVHHPAPTRATLRLGELSQKRLGVLHAAQKLLEDWQDEPQTFLDVESAQHKARVLVQQALENLRSQKGFAAERSLGSTLDPLRHSAEDGQHVSKLLQATLRAAAGHAALEERSLNALVESLSHAADDELKRKEAEALQCDLEQFLPQPGGGKGA